MFTKAAALKLTKQQRERLEFLSKSGQTPQRVALRARIVLLASSGLANHAIAKQLGICRPTVLLTRHKFEHSGVPGILKDAPRPGRNKVLSPEKEALILRTTLEEKPQAALTGAFGLLQSTLGFLIRLFKGCGRSIIYNRTGRRPLRYLATRILLKSFVTLSACI